MRFGRRDHESFIGGYDPEHEMPNPDRDPRERWQSDAYRRNAADGRWAYRWNPDRFEDRRDFGWREPRRMDREIQPRDRYESRPYGYDRERYGYGFRSDFDRDRDRWMDRDRGIDRDYEYDRERYFGRDYDRANLDRYDPWAPRDRYDRERFRDDWEWMGGEWDREGRYGRGGGRY